MLSIIRSFNFPGLPAAGLLLFAAVLPAESATIRGRILEPETNTYLEGVEVRIEGTSLYRYSRRGGEFAFRGLEPGTYTLTFQYALYPEVRRTIELAAADSVITLEQQLDQGEIFELEALTVEGTIMGQAKAFSQKRAASNVREIISSDAFGQFVDRNAAEALQRVAGISVEDSQGEGKFIIIRGADPSLNTIAIDGVIAATPEEDGRSTGLNIISIDQLERIEVDKTWLPDQWANFVGGSVNLVTRSALDREGLFVNTGGAVGKYEIADKESYRYNLAAGTSWNMGASDSRFGLQVSVDQSEDNRGSDTLDTKNWDPIAQPDLKFVPTTGFGLEGLELEDYLITRERTGLSCKLEFELNPSNRWEASLSYNKFEDDEVLQETDLNPDVDAVNDFSGPDILNEERALALGYDLTDPEVSARLNGLNEIERRLFFDEAVQLGAVAYNPEYQVYTLMDFVGGADKVLQTTTTSDSILTYQFAGENQVSDNWKLDYIAYISEAEKDWNERVFALEVSNDFKIFIDEQWRPYVYDNTGKLADPSSFRLGRDDGIVENNFYSSRDDRIGGEANLSIDWELAALRMATKAGVALDQRDKEFQRDFNQYSDFDSEAAGAAFLTLADEPLYGGEIAGFLSDYGDYTFGSKFDSAATRRYIDDFIGVYFLSDQNDDLTANITDATLKNYIAEEDITAAYLMQTIQFEEWEIIAGLRYEETKNTFLSARVVTRREELPQEVQDSLPASFQFIQPRFWTTLIKNFGEDVIIQRQPEERSYDHLLPALHVIRRIGDNWVARGSVTWTIARPKYTDLVPREIVGVSGARFSDSAELPNFDLMPMESVNYDLSLSYFFDTFGLISVAAYYKDLDGPVYEEIRTLSLTDPVARDLTDRYFSNPLNVPEWSTSTMQNAGSGELYGLEISLEKRFTGLPSPLDGFGISANASFIDSEVELLAEDREGEKVPLFLQSDTLANLSLYYEKYGFLLKASWTFRGKYLDNTILAGSNLDDLKKLGLPENSLDPWIDDYDRLDLLFEYRPFDWLSIFIEGSNVLNEPRTRYYGSPVRLAEVQYTDAVYFAGLKFIF